MAAPSPSSTTTRTWRSRRSARLADPWKRFFDEHATLLVIASAAFLAVFVVLITAGIAWARDDRAPSVRVLGSGSRLSLLVTSGDARLLIASGNDASAFGNALTRARHPTSRRIDVVVLAGTADDLPVASKAARAFSGAELFVIDGPLVRHLDELGIPGARVIAKPMRMRLPGGVDVILWPVAERDGNWSARITRGPTSVVGASDIDAAGEFVEGASAIVLTRGYSADVLPALPGKALVLPARSASLSKLRGDAASGGFGGFWALRIPAAGAVRLTFGPRGLELPGDARRVGPATPAASVSARPLPVAPPATPRTPV